MRAVFADTFYSLSLWNPDDKAHAKTVEFTRGYRQSMLTTDWIITELADALCRRPNRARFLRFLQILRQQKDLTIIPATRGLLDEGLAFYESRPDKDWSLTDCISFVAMTSEGVTDALTADHHFEQAGFVALLK